MPDVSKSPHQNEVSHSEERHTFQREAYIKRCKEDGQTPDPEQVEMYEKWKEDDIAKQNDPNWQKDNLEYDLRTTEWILEKVRGDEVYAQHVYAALCNTDWQRAEPWPILKNEMWSCNWRHAGGIVADMREEGDYIDWYCSGIIGVPDDNIEEWLKTATDEQIKNYKKVMASMPEGTVTDEIKTDFLKLGWLLVWEYEPD